MDSEKIKAIVAIVKDITQTGDTKFQENETRNLASNLMINLNAHAAKSPTFAVAVIQRLKDEGFDLTVLRGEAFQVFEQKFSRTINKLDDPKREMIRKISDRIFT